MIRFLLFFARPFFILCVFAVVSEFLMQTHFGDKTHDGYEWPRIC